MNGDEKPKSWYEDIPWSKRLEMEDKVAEENRRIEENNKKGLVIDYQKIKKFFKWINRHKKDN